MKLTIPALALFTFCTLAQAQTTYTFTSIPAAGFAAAINDRGQILLENQGFAANYIYSQETGALQSFILPYPAAAYGFNNLDQIVGYDPGGTQQGQYQAGAGGTPTVFQFLPGQLSKPTAINDAGIIVGTVLSGTVWHAALYQNGQSTLIDYPGATATYPTGVNDAGLVVGYYQVGTSSPHGFTYFNHRFSTLDVPRSLQTLIRGVNNLGEMVGNYSGSRGVNRGFVYSGGHFITLNDPSGNILHFTLVGINDEGQIAGAAFGDFPPSFVATPNYFSGF